MNPFVLGFAVFTGVLALVCITLSVNIYNALVSLKNQVDRAWANIDVILKQRFDEIPQLVSVLEQFANYERDTLERVVEARKQYINARGTNEQVAAATAMSGALANVLALGEAYPELKSSSQFIELSRRISELEGQIADRRELYNEAVTNFNTRCQSFPDLFFVGALGYQQQELYRPHSSETKRASLKINLPKRAA